MPCTSMLCECDDEDLEGRDDGYNNDSDGCDDEDEDDDDNWHSLASCFRHVILSR